MFYWILLGLAIAAEITGTLSMKWASVSDGNSGFILMLVMIAASYIFSLLPLKKSPSVWPTHCGKGSAFYLLRCLACCYLMSRCRP